MLRPVRSSCPVLEDEAMTSARGVGRWIVIGVGGMAALVLVLRISAEAFLHSSSGRTLVAERLGSMIGLPVQVADLDVGTQNSTIKFRVLDPALGTSPNAEVLTVDSASADVSFADLITGRAQPHELRLDGVSLLLRMDANGKVLTTIPAQQGGTSRGKIPSIVLNNGRVTIQQEGHPAFQLTGISLRAEPSGDKVVIRGSIDDPTWSKWKISGEVDQATKTGWIDVATDDVVVDTERLKSLPAIPLSMWEHVQPNGHAMLVAHLTLGEQNDFKYDVTLQPKSATLGIPPAGITLTDINGVVRIRDGVAEASGVDGKSGIAAKLAGGTVSVSTKWDYSKDPAVGDPLLVSVRHLAVKDLPPKWGLKDLGGELPGKLSLENGLLSGNAKLKLMVHKDGRFETYGSGAGTIKVPSFAQGSLEIGVKLGGDGQRLQFNAGGAAPAPPAPPKEPGAVLAPQPGRLANITPTTNPVALTLNPSPSGGEGGSRGEPGEGTPKAVNVTVTNERELFALLTFLTLQPKAAPPQAQQTNVEATITLRDIDVAQFMQQLELKVPYKVAGKVTVRAKLAVPLSHAATRSSYRFEGTLTSPELRFEGLTVHGLSAEVNYQDGKLTLNTLRGTIPQPDDPQARPGTFKGTASAALNPAGDVTASLALERIPAKSVVGAAPSLGVEANGLVSGRADFKAPYERLTDLTTWEASAALHSDRLTVAGRTATALAVNAVVSKGVLTLNKAGATIEEIPVTVDGTLSLTEKHKFDVAVKTAGTSIADFRKLVPEMTPPVPVEGVLETDSKITGTLSPLTFTATGRVHASKLTLAKTPANDVAFHWEVTQERVKLSDLNATVFGGTVTGSVDYPFDTQKTGAFNVSFKDLDAAAASALVPDFPVKITGRVSGKVVGTVPEARAGQSRVGNLDVDLTAPRLTVQGIPAERLAGKAAIKNGGVDYSLEGHTLGGTFDIKGRYPGLGKQEPRQEPNKDGRGSLRISDVDLAQLAGALKSNSLRPLRGRVDLTFSYANDLSEGSGRLSVRGLAWGNSLISREILGVLSLRDGVLELRDLGGTFARGFLRGRAQVRLKEPARNFFSLAVDRVDAKRLLAPIPDLAGLVDGDLTIAVRGSIGREMRGSGTVAITRGSIGGVKVSELRLPFSYTTATAPYGYGRLTVREATSHAGSGRAVASATAEWGTGLRVSGQVRFIDVPLRDISSTLGENSYLGNGRVTGRIDLSGTDVRSVDDLTGTLIARLSNTSVKEVPLLTQTIPFLNPIGLTQPFQSGDVRGTLARGIFRVQRLALVNPAAQLFASGTITKAGQISFGVVAHTGPIGPQAVGFRLLARRLPVLGPIPLGLIRDVSNLVTNRTVRLSVTGTISSPVVRVNVGALLAEEAVRFLLTQYVLPSEVSDVLGGGGVGGILGGSPSP